MLISAYKSNGRVKFETNAGVLPMKDDWMHVVRCFELKSHQACVVECLLGTERL